MNPVTRSSRVQLRWLPVMLVGVVAPLVLHYAVVSQHPLLAALWWPVIGLCVTGAILWHRFNLPVLTGFIACAGAAVWVYETGNLAGAITPSLAINLALMVYFGRTLRRGREAFITRIARVERSHSRQHFPDDMRRYTRTLTAVWCAFFGVNAAVALLLAVQTPLATWSLYANVLNAPLVAAMFIGEYIYRRWRFPDHPHISPWSLAVRIASSPKEYLGGRG